MENILKNKTVLLRLDLNVPLAGEKILDDERIIKSLPTINYLLEKGANIFIVSHLGRPTQTDKDNFSLAPVAQYLKQIYQDGFNFISNIDEPHSVTQVNLLENIRFEEGELKNDSDLAQKLAGLADVYVNDAFSCSHRAHASIDKITKFIPSYKGSLFASELENIQKFFNFDGKKLAIIGGKKIAGKYEALEQLLQKVDKLAVVGGMANTFLKAQGVNIGSSFYEDAYVKDALQLLKNFSDKLLIPCDAVVAKKNTDEFVNVRSAVLDDIAEDEMILDVGAKSAKNICELIGNSNAVMWNGPLGLFEDKRFAHASNAVAKKIAERTKQQKLFSIAGGGDTISCIKESSGMDGFSFISTGGGAFLDLLAGHTIYGANLPSILHSE